MLLEDLLALPVGASVLGEIEVLTKLPGVIAELHDGSHFIRWGDGYSTIPLGKVREYDEYIAAHTEPVRGCDDRPLHPARVTERSQRNRPSQAQNVPPDWDDPVHEDTVEMRHE